MVDQNKWRHYREKEARTSQQVYTDLFPRICERLRDDPVQVIEFETPPQGRTTAENNAMMVPQFKEMQRSNSLFVERRRFPRHASG